MSIELEQKIAKPWGKEKIIIHGDRYIIKILHIAASHGTSVHLHTVKDESLTLLEGEGTLLLFDDLSSDPDRIQMEFGEWYRILPNQIHRIESSTGGHVIEVSTPELDDTIRLIDPYIR